MGWLLLFRRWRGPKDWRWRYQMVFVLVLLGVAFQQALAWPPDTNVAKISDLALVAVTGAAALWWWRAWKAAD